MSSQPAVMSIEQQNVTKAVFIQQPIMPFNRFTLCKLFQMSSQVNTLQLAPTSPPRLHDVPSSEQSSVLTTILF